MLHMILTEKEIEYLDALLCSECMEEGDEPLLLEYTVTIQRILIKLREAVKYE